MSGSSWNNPIYLQQDGNGQPQVGGIKLFDPTQFQASPQFPGVNQVDVNQKHYTADSEFGGYYNQHQNIQPLHDQTQNQGSGWNSWNTWSWNSQGENSQVSGETGFQTHTDKVSKTNSVHENINQDQQQNHYLQYSTSSQFYNTSQYQDGGNELNTNQAAQNLSQQHPEASSYYGQWGSNQWPAASDQNLAQQTHGSQEGVTFGYPGEQSQSNYFDSSAWSINPDSSASHLYSWSNTYDTHSHQILAHGKSDATTDHGDEYENQNLLTEQHPSSDRPNDQGGKRDGINTEISQPPSISMSIENTVVPSEDSHSTQEHDNPLATHKVVADSCIKGHTRGSSIDSDVNGTVAGFFGKDDIEEHAKGSPQSLSNVRTIEFETGIEQPMQHLKVTNFHRTDSGISNASLQTINLSADEESKDGLEEITGQVNNLNLDGHDINSEMTYNASSLSLDNQSGFFGVSGKGPLQTNDGIKEEAEKDSATREVDQQSPMMNDWEIVQLHSQTIASHSNTYSLDTEMSSVKLQENVGTTEIIVPSILSETYSSITQDSESFTAISSTSSSGEGISQSSVPYHPSASSTPFTSPGSQSVMSQLSSVQHQYASHVADKQSSSAFTSPSQALKPSLMTQTLDVRSLNQQQNGSLLNPALESNKSVTETNAQQPLPMENGSEAYKVNIASVKQGVTSPCNSGGSLIKKTSPSVRNIPNATLVKEPEILLSPTRRQSAFHPVHSHRGKHNMSPATTLWDNLDSAPASNILLAPAAPLNIPAFNTALQDNSNIASIPSSTSTPAPITATFIGSNPLEKVPAGRNVKKSVERSSEYRKYTRQPFDRREIDKSSTSKPQSEDLSHSRDDDNRSLGSLDELDHTSSDLQNDLSLRDKSKGYGRDPRYDPYYDRPSSRTDSYRDEFRRQRDPYRASGRDYRDQYYDERYERPRSRQDEERPSRPASRTTRDMDNRALAEYERDRHSYYQHQRELRYRAYPGYDGYDYYYDERERCYRYYSDSRYRRGYDLELDYYNYDRYPRYYGPLAQPALQHFDDVDHSSLASHSRGHTPAMDDGDPSDYYNQHVTRLDGERDTYRYPGYNGYDHYGTYYDQYLQNPYSYYQSQEGVHRSYQGRMTPPKYLLPHVRTCFGPTGQLIMVLPNRPADGQPAIVEIHDVQVLLQENPDVDELKAFSGPLVRNETHKNDVLLFCQKKAKDCFENIDLMDRESAVLIWRLLELLIKQNGSMMGTDIADLLLEGHEPSTHEYLISGMPIVPSSDALELPEGSEDSRTSSPSVRVTADRSIITATQQLEEATDRFRHYLLYGRKKEALDWAMKHNLWGHALFLASKMDNRTHANIMTRFANTAMRMNDPLQTLYQLMSGRQPASVTNVCDERWGDWRPHLAMILSNHSSRPDLDKKSVISLGDTLATKHCLHASHFCYLMAQVEFGSFIKKTSKIVLIGSNHNLSLNEFANNIAIQCTEIYEYAQSLGNPKFCLPQFQLYKFLYACRLAEYGFVQEAFHYCEVITLQVLMYPARYRPAFIKILYSLASQLKHCDPQKMHEGHDSADPLWLEQLNRVSDSYEEGLLQFKSGTGTPMTGYGDMTPSSESEVASYGMDNNPQDSNAYVTTSNIQQSGQTQYGGEVRENNWNHQQYTEGQYVQYNQYTAPEQNNQQQQQHTEPQKYDSSQYQHSNWQNFATGIEYNHGYGEAAPLSASYHTSVPAGTEQQSQQQSATQSGSYNDLQKNDHRHSIASSGTITDNAEDDEDYENEVSPQQDPQFDYFGVASQPISVPPHRYRTTSTSSTGSTHRRRRRTMSGSSTGSIRASHPSKPAPEKKPDTKKDSSGTKSSGGGNGWLGGLLSKFGRKDKNEMILPDDKNPSIIWDPVTKKWTNKNADDNETMSSAPPPRDTDLMAKAPVASVPGIEPGQALNGPPTGNRFTMQRGRGARGQYVDVLNPKAGSSSSPVPTSLFNVLPTTSVVTTTASSGIPQLFNPLNASSTSSQGPASQPEGNIVTPPSHSLSRSSSLSSLSREIQQLTRKAQEFGNTDLPKTVAQSTEPSSAQLSTAPVLFNPTQFSQPGVINSGIGQQPASSGPGLKYGHRRIYPK